MNLTLTSDNDPQLQVLMESMRAEDKVGTRWFRLGGLMMKLAQFCKAQQVYETMLNQTENGNEKRYIYQQLGSIIYHKGNNTEALSYYEKVLEILQRTLPANHPSLATSYNNIGLVCHNMGEYSKAQALSYYGKALETLQKTLPANHPELATSYNNIGLVCGNMGEYSKALSYCQRASDIIQCSLSPNHPNFQKIKKNFEAIKNRFSTFVRLVVLTNSGW